MTKCSIASEGHGTGELTAVHEVQCRSAGQQQSIKRALNCIDPELVRFYRSEITSRRKMISPVFHLAFLITDTPESDAQRYSKDVYELFHCNNSKLK